MDSFCREGGGWGKGGGWGGKVAMKRVQVQAAGRRADPLAKVGCSLLPRSRDPHELGDAISRGPDLHR